MFVLQRERLDNRSRCIMDENVTAFSLGPPLTYEEIITLCKEVVKQVPNDIKSVYGIPRGGIIPAYIIANLLDLPLVDIPHSVGSPSKLAPALIVDDILDSGRTLDGYTGIAPRAVLINKNPEKYKDVIFAKEGKIGDWVTFPWEIQDAVKGIQREIVRILQYIGEDPNREGLLETPKRVQRAYQELFAGYRQRPEQVLSKEFSTSYDQMVVLSDIEFFSFCEHHMLPFFGKASVAYIPRHKVVGISKLARLVDVYARRLQIQEQMTDQIASAIEDVLHPLGVAVTITAKHFCMVTRGVKKQNSEMTTTSLRGAFKENPETRAEFFSRI